MKSIFNRVDTYISSVFAPEDQVLTGIIRSLEDANMPQHSISPTQGKFLEVMARLCHSRKILELGTLGAYSTVWLGRSLPEGGRLITVEINPDHAGVARENIVKAGLSGVVDIRLGDAVQILEKIADSKEGPFDLIFIDADKTLYIEYFELALALSRPGTLIIADNVIREGKVLDKNSTDEKVRGVQRFNRMLSADPRVTATIMQTVGIKEHDGMALAVVH